MLAPGAVKLADLNGDGIPDLIVANSGSNNVLVYPGLGNGQFGPPVNGAMASPPAPTRPASTVANLNGQPDLLVANTGSNDVSVLLGQGSGSSWTMIPGPRIKTGAGPVALAVGNLARHRPARPGRGQQPGQHRPGLPGRRRRLLQRPAAGDRTTRSARHPSALFLGNFSGSGLGLATLNAGSNDGTLITGLGSASPQTQTFPTGGDRPTTGFAGDFNGNGFTDLVVGNNGDGQLSLLLGGSGGLSLSQTLSSAEAPSPTGLTFGGVSDGLLDFYVSTAGHEAAINLAFDLNASPESEGGVPSVDVTPVRGVVASAGVLAQATSGSVQQVAQLLSLTGTTLDLAATLLTVSVVETESSGAAALTASSTAPGQAQAKGNGGSGESGDELAEKPEGGRGSSPGRGGEDAAVGTAVDGI